jgi:hypothetical protein
MLHPIRRTGFTSSLTRSVAVAALLSLPLAAAPLSVVHAQTKPTPAATSPTDQKPEGVEQRITQLHTELKISPDLESKWNSVAQAMRDNAANMEKLIASKRSQAPQSLTAVDDLTNYEDFARAHLDGLKNLTSSFKSLYDSMPDGQKKNADQVFQSFGRAPTQG